MAELATVARPYAEAAFKAALDAHALAPWEEGLALAGAIAADPEMTALLANPRLGRPDKRAVFFGVGGERLPMPVRNLVTLLIDADRAGLLPEIARQFEALRRAHENILQVTIVSAKPMADAERDALAATLAAKHGRRVVATVKVDETLIGGARIHVGDEVIHGSVRDALDQMALALSR